MNKKFTLLISLYIIIITLFIYVGIELAKENNEKVSEILKLKETIEKNNSDILQLKTEINDKDLELDVLREENKRLKEDFKKYESLKSLQVTATAYTSYCDGCSGFTKNETDVRKTIYKNGLRIIAVDERIIPLNSIVYVETEEEKFLAVADDIGGAIKGNRIDILVPSKKVAVNFGRQKNVKITIIKRG